MKKSRILQGDCLDVLKKLPENSVDSVVCDPPYGLSKEPDIAEVMQHWIAGDHYKHGSAGFMGKTWDSFVPGPEYWRECLRVLKPGGHMLVFAGTRTWDLMSIAIRFAGGELRDTVQWVYGSGFPKSHNVSKSIDRAAGIKRTVVGSESLSNDMRNSSLLKSARGERKPNVRNVTVATSDAAKKWEGYGTALKPAWEPILVFRKPLEKGLSIAENVLKYGTGGLNIDASRIGVAESDPNHRPGITRTVADSRSMFGVGGQRRGQLPTGRFPANLLLSHTLFCVQKGVKRVKVQGTGGAFKGKNASFPIDNQKPARYQSKDGTETVEAWECDASCPVRELDRQSGVSKSPTKSIQRKNTWGANGIYGAAKNVPTAEFGDSGGASRFFYVCKPSRRERNAGCEGLGGNKHCTVKPVRLLSYLLTMVTPPGGTCLDPFLGSGTTAVAAKSLGFRFIGIEQSKAYVRIARARVKAA